MKKESIEDKLKRLREENPFSPHLKDNYELEGLVPGLIGWKGKQYDLRKIKPDVADRLIVEGFPNLKKKTASTTAAPASKKN